MMHKLLIHHHECLYRFLAFEFRDHADGSLYLVFDRKSLGPHRVDWMPTSGNRTVVESTEKLRISYHASGQVNIHGASTCPIFCEPLYAITAPQPLACISLPEVARLTPANGKDKAIAIIEIPDETKGRITFHLTLLPTGAAPPAGTLAVVNYERWFGIAVIVAPLPFEVPDDLASHVIKALSTKGKYNSLCVTQDQALISFHRKRINVSASIVTSWEPTEGVYRVIFAVPMMTPPRSTIQFANPDVEACIILLTRSEMRFKARGPGGYIKSRPEPILRFELSSEL